MALPVRVNGLTVGLTTETQNTFAAYCWRRWHA